MNKGVRITLICIISLLILLVIGGTIFGYVQKYAYADYQDVIANPNSVVNFNQISNNIDISITDQSQVNESSYYYKNFSLGNSVDFVVGHRYFIIFQLLEHSPIVHEIRVYFNSYTQVYVSSGERTTALLTYSSFDFLRIYATNTNYYNAHYNLCAIDLDAMFGSENIPTLQECQEIFVAQYYPYNLGTPIYNDTLQAYTNGVNAYLSTTELTMNTGDFIGSCYAVNLNNEYLGYGNYTDETASINWSVLVKGDNYVTLTPVPNNNDAISTICLPFYATLKAGTQITITGYIYDGAYNQVHKVGVGYWIANNMVEIGNMTGYSGSPVRYKQNTLTYVLPVDIDRIYIYCGLDGQNIQFQNFSVSYYLTDIEALKSASAKYGYEQAKSYYDTYYGVDGDGYKEIYNVGKQYGLQHNDANAWGNAWEFIQSAFTGIGSIFSIELLPNVPLSVFVLVPLMVGLIFFIIKVVKGGGS